MAHAPNTDEFEAFLANVTQATNEAQKREHFIVLAARAFEDNEFATRLAVGAEYSTRFRKAGVLRRGRMDTFYGNLIIEFENDLAKTQLHALEQLRAYVAGAWNEDGSAHRSYLAVATDGLRWEVYTPNLASSDDDVSLENVALTFVESWDIKAETPASLRAFLNRLFFRKFTIVPNPANFVRDFGLQSPSFRRIAEALRSKLENLTNDPQIRVYKGAWATSLQYSYGTIETDDDLFVRHTYLAVLARMLVWATLEKHTGLDIEELTAVLQGDYFQSRQLANLHEDDFFQWHEIDSPGGVMEEWKALAHHLKGYDLTTIQHDILKPLYEQLVDPSTRHDLGEYYTPDWLANKVTRALLKSWREADGVPRVLDPSCGSGTFLRAVLEYIRQRILAQKDVDRSALLRALVANIVGIDVHPLAVTIARATYALAIADLISMSRDAITIPVFLSNSLNMPEVARQRTLDQSEDLLLEIGDKGSDSQRGFHLPLYFVENGPLYDKAVTAVARVARDYGKKKKEIKQSLIQRTMDSLLRESLLPVKDSESILRTLVDMAVYMAELVQRREDSVYGFMLRNWYRPSMLRNSFDFVIGNPPWLTIDRIQDPAYKHLILRLTEKAAITSRSAGAQAHTEVAMVFLAAAFEGFLKLNNPLYESRLAFVLPRSLFTARHHNVLRTGKQKTQFDIAEIWDLDKVAPLFGVPTCVVFASAGQPRPQNLKPGLVIAGRLSAKEISIAEAEKIQQRNVEFEVAYLGRSTAWRPLADGSSAGVYDPSADSGAYADDFRQGAVIYPQMLFVVEGKGSPISRDHSVLRVVTSPDVTASAKVSTAKVNHVICTRNLYCTVAAQKILPFVVVKSRWHVVIPTLGDPGTPAFRSVSAEDLRMHGMLETAAWADWVEHQWVKVRKKGETIPLYQRLDHIGQLSAQAQRDRYVVVYNAAGSRVFAGMIDCEEEVVPFVARDRTYWASFSTRREALYLLGFLNSEYAHVVIEDFVNRGLFGRRDSNKRILDVPWPRFDKKKGSHLELAAIAGRVYSAASRLLEELPDGAAGAQRTWMRRQLNEAFSADLESAVRAVGTEGPDEPEVYRLQQVKDTES